MTLNLNSNEASGVVRTFGGELVSYKKDGIEYVMAGTPGILERSGAHTFPGMLLTQRRKNGS